MMATLCEVIGNKARSREYLSTKMLITSHNVNVRVIVDLQVPVIQICG